MSENELIGAMLVALGTIVGTGITIAKPLLQVVKTMTILNESIKTLTEKFNKFEVNNHDDHKRIWLHNEKQDELIQEHETQIRILKEGQK